MFPREKGHWLVQPCQQDSEPQSLQQPEWEAKP